MTKYVCGSCDRHVELDNRKPVECPYCGFRVLHKPASKRPVQLVSK